MPEWQVLVAHTPMFWRKLFFEKGSMTEVAGKAAKMAQAQAVETEKPAKSTEPAG